MPARKSTCRAAVATVLVATACLTACSNSTSTAGVENAQPEVVVNTSNETAPAVRKHMCYNSS